MGMEKGVLGYQTEVEMYWPVMTAHVSPAYQGQVASS